MTWIRVTERVPPDRVDVLACDADRDIVMLRYHEEDSTWWFEDTEYGYGPVTHWMPLPIPPPKEDETL